MKRYRWTQEHARQNLEQMIESYGHMVFFFFLKKIEFTIEELVWQAIPHVQGVVGTRKYIFLPK